MGIGLSHKLVIEDMFGMSYDEPAKHMREYIDVLTPLLKGEAVSYSGEQYKVNGSLNISGASEVPLIIAALGPVMLTPYQGAMCAALCTACVTCYKFIYENL
ncbi:MAG: 5,10-methylenetetrahydromethanopterin reductase [Pseudomonadales bacterium]